MNSLINESRAKKDFTAIIDMLNESEYQPLIKFGPGVRDSFLELLEQNKLFKRLTNIFIKIHSIDNISIYEKKSLWMMLMNRKGYIEVRISARADYYWIVDGQMSGEPGSIETEGICENASLDFYLRYSADLSEPLLIGYWDDKLTNFGPTIAI